MKRSTYIFLTIITLLLFSCVYPYEVELKEGSSGTVVIEGNILCGEISKFKIALTNSVSDTISPVYAVHELYIEGENGQKYNGKKVYDESLFEVDTRGLEKDVRYRFVAKISKEVTAASYAKTYSTDYMPVLITPPIDSISYHVSSDETSVSIKVTSHDDVAPVGYYRWDFEENWEFTSTHQADYEYEYYSNSITEIKKKQNRYYCWGKAVSTDVLIYSTEDLGVNVAPLVTLKTINGSDKRVNKLYCIDVNQYSITEDTYKFWDVILRNETSAGSIFSPQPSKPRGNIVCEEDKNEYVIGWISCSTVSKMRKFITKAEFGIYNDPWSCVPKNLGQDEWQGAYIDGYDVITKVDGNPPYVWAKKECVDCRVFGTKQKPDFWPTDSF